MAVISLELNELNFHFIKKYTAEGKLPGFNRFLQNHVIFETVSESGYPYLEPWSQWPTVYTGLTYDEHRCKSGRSWRQPGPRLAPFPP